VYCDRRYHIVVWWLFITVAWHWHRSVTAKVAWMSCPL